MDNYRLYIDETGNSSLNHYNKNFTVCGIIVKPEQSENLKIKADQIKFKYWNHTNVVFHSIDIGKQRKDFAILQDTAKNKDFLDDLMNFLQTGEFLCVSASVDKSKALAQHWDSGKVVDKAIEKVIETFIEFLVLNKGRGQVIIESSSATDIVFYKKYAQYLSHGFPKLGTKPAAMKDILTSLSFVSKKNYDIEAQLADLMAYPSTCKFLHDEGIKLMDSGSYEERICNITETKLLQISGIKTAYRMP